MNYGYWFTYFIIPKEEYSFQTRYYKNGFKE